MVESSSQQKRVIDRTLLLTLLILSIVTLLSSCRDQPDGTSTSPTLPVLSVEAYWDWAHEEALSWHTDAQVFEVYTEVDLPNSSLSNSVIRFTFVSPTDRLTEWIFSCTPEGCKTFEIERETGFPSQLCVFNREDFQIDSGQALKIALDEGITNYVKDEKAWVNLKLGHTGTCLDDVVWMASGFISSPLQSTFVWIDAMTGEVIESPYRTEP